MTPPSIDARTRPAAAPPSTTMLSTLGSEPGVQLSDADFQRVRALILARAGINLQAGKQAMVHSRLSRRLRETSHRSFASYLDALERGGDGAEWQGFINALTTNLTAFFREEHHFEELAQTLRARRGQRTTIWCSAASTGEEPYTLAMTAVEALGANPDVRILATDIDTQVLSVAQRAVYDASARGLSAERRQRHCQRGTGANGGLMRIRPEVAKLVSFRTLNLIAPDWGLREPFDILFCRNVMIYFDAPTQRQILKRMHGLLADGGLLFVGHSENFSDQRTLFRLRGKTIYEKV